jgi:hypothetical protein
LKPPAHGAHSRGEQQKYDGAGCAEKQQHRGSPCPREIGEAAHGVDQPVKAARRFHESCPPAEKKRTPEVRGSIHGHEHGDRGDPGQR